MGAGTAGGTVFSTGKELPLRRPGAEAQHCCFASFAALGKLASQT